MLSSSSKKVKLESVVVPITTWNPATDPRRIRYVDVSAISRKTCRIESTATHDQNSAPSRARKLVNTDDTILATIRPSLKRIARVPSELHGEVVSTAFCVLRPNKELIDPGYLFYAVRTSDFSEAVVDRETGASYPAVRDSDVLNQEIVLPPLPLQHSIALVLSMLEKAARLTSDAERAATTLKIGSMQRLFTRGLRDEPQKETEIGPIPQSWEVKPLDALCTMRSGGTPPKGQAELWDGPVPWVSGKDLKKNRLADVPDHISADAAAWFSAIAPAESVLVLMRGMGLVKGFALSLIERPMAFNQDLKALVPKGDVGGDYLMHALSYAGNRMLRNVTDAAHGTKRLTQDDLDRFHLGIAPLEERTAIVEILDAIDTKIDLHKRKRAVLDELFKSLLNGLMGGSIDVNDLDLSVLEGAS